MNATENRRRGTRSGMTYANGYLWLVGGLLKRETLNLDPQNGKVVERKYFTCRVISGVTTVDGKILLIDSEKHVLFAMYRIESEVSQAVKEDKRERRLTKCPHCGAPLEGRMVACQYCGAQVKNVVSEGDIRESCIALIESMNKSLESIVSGKILACFIAGFVLVPVLVYFLIGHFGGSLFLRWGLSIGSAVLGMVFFGFMLSLEQSKMFKGELKQRVQKFLRRNDLKPEEFLSIARSVLKKNDPMFEHLDRLIE